MQFVYDGNRKWPQSESRQNNYTVQNYHYYLHHKQLNRTKNSHWCDVCLCVSNNFCWSTDRRMTSATAAAMASTLHMPIDSRTKTANKIIKNSATKRYMRMRMNQFEHFSVFKFIFCQKPKEFLLPSFALWLYGNFGYYSMYVPYCIIIIAHHRHHFDWNFRIVRYAVFILFYLCYYFLYTIWYGMCLFVRLAETMRMRCGEQTERSLVYNILCRCMHPYPQYVKFVWNKCTNANKWINRKHQTNERMNDRHRVGPKRHIIFDVFHRKFDVWKEKKKE